MTKYPNIMRPRDHACLLHLNISFKNEPCHVGGGRLAVSGVGEGYWLWVLGLSHFALLRAYDGRCFVILRPSKCRTRHPELRH